MSFGFIRPSDIADILIIATSFYLLFMLIRETRAVQGLKLFAVLIIASFIASSLNLSVTSWILAGLWTILPLSLVIIFQPELRFALIRMGRGGLFAGLYRQKERTAFEIVEAVKLLSDTRTGALIAIERKTDLKSFVETGIKLDAFVTKELLCTIFTHNTLLHDGAVIIKQNRVVAASCLLPLQHESKMNPPLGTRHRAALGLSSETDAIVIVVSEETGKICIAVSGELIETEAGRLDETLAHYRKREE
jgi:diadenylate cyclase